MQAPIPIPSSIALLIPGTHKLPIEVVESSDKTRTLDNTQKQSKHITKHISKLCVGAYLAMPDGVLPYCAYPFMLHEVFVLPWNIHVVNHQLSIQSIHCTGVQETSSDSCDACSQLLTHRIVEGILHRIKNGIHANTNFAYQPIASLIEILRKKCVLLNGLRFKQLSTSRTLATRAQTLGRYEQFVMVMSEGNVNRLDALLWVGLNRGAGVRGMM